MDERRLQKFSSLAVWTSTQSPIVFFGHVTWTVPVPSSDKHESIPEARSIALWTTRKGMTGLFQDETKNLLLLYGTVLAVDEETRRTFGHSSGKSLARMSPMVVLMTASLPTTVLVSATTCICEAEE